MNLIQPRRILVAAGMIAGACAIAVPAALGLSGNLAVSQRIPVSVPAAAQQVSFTNPDTDKEPGDDRGRHSEPGDDRRRHREHDRDDQRRHREHDRDDQRRHREHDRDDRGGR